MSLSVGKVQFHALRWLLSAGMTAGEVTVDGVAMPYLSCGAGVPVLLIHGFGADKETWLPLARTLSRRRRVIMMDLPGFGAADQVGSERGHARAQAAAVAGFADALGYYRVHLCGNSMGGGISLRFAADYPERVRSMALICSAGPEVARSEVLEILDAGGPNPLIPATPADGDEFLRLVMQRPPKVPAALQRYTVARSIARSEQNQRMWLGWRESPEADSMPPNLEAIDAPALVIHGEHDRVIHPAVGANLADRLANAEHVVISGVGHVPQIEAPLHTARLLQQFWSRHD